jgi:hypothetical protein
MQFHAYPKEDLAEVLTVLLAKGQLGERSPGEKMESVEILRKNGIFTETCEAPGMTGIIEISLMGHRE